jgi:hypothetical protein
VEIDCPEDCVYLSGAHAGAWEGRENERRRDMLRLAPHVQKLGQRQAQLFFLALAGLGGLRLRRRDLDDRLLAQAVAAFRKTLETRSKGLVYEHTPDDPRGLGVLHDLEGMFEAQDERGRMQRPDDRDLLPVLTALDASLSATLEEQAGPTAFLDTVGRIAGRPERPAPKSRLIFTP